MGYIRHHAIVVTSTDESRIHAAHAKALELQMSVTSVAGPVVNGHLSFLVGPDGSKEGWEDSIDGDVRRRKYKEWLNAQRFDDDSTPYDWVEVSYGEYEYCAPRVLADGDEIWRCRHRANLLANP